MGFISPARFRSKQKTPDATLQGLLNVMKTPAALCSENLKIIQANSSFIEMFQQINTTNTLSLLDILDHSPSFPQTQIQTETEQELIVPCNDLVSWESIVLHAAGENLWLVFPRMNHIHVLPHQKQNSQPESAQIIDILTGFLQPPKALNFTNIIQEICEKDGELCFGKQVVLQDTPPAIVGNEALIRMLFTLLFANCKNYRPVDRDLKITISYEGFSRFYAFHIQDNGIGMSADLVEHAFETFYESQLSESGCTNSINLAIVKEIIQQLKGLIKIHSELNKGTTISFTLPKPAVGE